MKNFNGRPFFSLFFIARANQKIPNLALGHQSSDCGEGVACSPLARRYSGASSLDTKNTGSLSNHSRLHRPAAGLRGLVVDSTTTVEGKMGAVTQSARSDKNP
jgi:hypothetical protein